MKMLETLFPVMEIPAGFSLSKKTNKISGYLPENTGHKFIIREDTGDVISCVTDKYKMVTNQQVIDAAKPVIKDIGAVLTEEKTFANGARSVWTWKIPDVKVKIDNKDYINPTLTLKNKHHNYSLLNSFLRIANLLCYHIF